MDSQETPTGPTEATESAIGAAIRERRKYARLTQQQLGELVGLSDKTIRDIEHGTGSARLRSILAILHALGLDLKVSTR